LAPVNNCIKALDARRNRAPMPDQNVVTAFRFWASAAIGAAQ
jgi:hypothetical protein